jgi:hypothetical protein
MPRRSQISRRPAGINRYLVDANFLANRFIPLRNITKPAEHQRIARSSDWWAELDKQIAAKKAVVYVPDLCIAEAFKVLAKKRYEDAVFDTTQYKKARDALSDLIRTPRKRLKTSTRHVAFHDISTSRDVVIAVDRFFEGVFKWKLNVSVVDLMILGTAKYLVEFYHIPKNELFIVTLDNALWKCTKKFSDVPAGFNPNVDTEVANRIFVS